eukprot:CAMPEP_0185782568 /NCGR_PEP_ID=MMETSP1174-20130828/109811_1 /TAXON_ID=35687 /ORGANISM="Dictyocha speculum, Strain CCMP1381" /LENGTH=96 /DNA_ID=CAMNT_0028473087 /DNA_START=62 /DNA_END=352 /DNA_ORIENTATION=+
MVEPTLTEDAPCKMASSKSPDIPMLSSSEVGSLASTEATAIRQSLRRVKQEESPGAPIVMSPLRISLGHSATIDRASSGACSVEIPDLVSSPDVST